jgi:hypothetical protein
MRIVRVSSRRLDAAMHAEEDGERARVEEAERRNAPAHELQQLPEAVVVAAVAGRASVFLGPGCSDRMIILFETLNFDDDKGFVVGRN